MSATKRKNSFHAKNDFRGLEEAVNALLWDDSENNDVANPDLIIIPPELDPLTDSEEFDEDNLDDNMLPTDLSGCVELDIDEDMIECDQSTGSSSVINSPLETQDQLSTSSSNSISEKYLAIDTRNCKLLKKDSRYSIEYNDNIYIETFDTTKESFAEYTPIMVFKEFLTDEIVQYMCDQTMLYAHSHKNNPKFRIDVEEMRVFIAILFFTGYHKLPTERAYWSLDEDLGVPLVSEAMTRDRYIEIKRYLHLADNTKINNSTDKMYEVRPLMNMLIGRFQQIGYFHSNLSIDESMIKYFGRHSAKQFIRGKPIRFGYKAWMLASSCGYCYDLDVYCGKNSVEARNIPLGASVVLNFVEKIPNPERHAIFFDNYFTTHSLMRQLADMKLKASGTVRENRISNCKLDNNKIFKRRSRGSYDCRYDTLNDILAVKWVDNNVCSILTNFDKMTPMHYVKRWSRESQSKINVPQPNVCATYNKHMGGVDNIDQNVSAYRIAIRGKKWWWVIFTYLIDMAMTNGSFICQSIANAINSTRNCNSGVK
ncbi:piggyBac transposable element-derived protein 3-like [Eurosta solidaginis]|uniref:piggyBac transposable element-derived protein 3-like n=1 Tax=Eurosta solidaginis TaxID=178769 RepID=UPI00353100C7